MDLLKPNIDQDVKEAQHRQVRNCENSNSQRVFEEGEAVSTTNFGRGERWLSGLIKSKKGPLTYEVELDDGRIIKRHIDHIIKRQCSNITEGKENPARKWNTDDFRNRNFESEEVGKHYGEDHLTEKHEVNNPQQETLEQTNTSDRNSEETTNETGTLRRSTRIKKPPDCFKF